MPPARAGREARGWAWRSARASSMRMRAAWISRARRGGERPLPLPCRSCDPLRKRLLKAIQVTQYGDYDVLRPIDLPAPQPRGGEALVRMTAAAVSALDDQVRRGLY